MSSNHHLRLIGLLKDGRPRRAPAEAGRRRRAQYAARSVSDVAGGTAAGEFPAGATLCGKCQTRAVIVMDGCMTCLNCGDSKCG